ncbi:MAG: ATPase, partial [Gemmatimonadetes bacterium]|nr:ATPase [Gemmatimonadota bacterium]
GVPVDQMDAQDLGAGRGVREIHPDRLSEELRRTRPLSVTMAEPISALRRWAEGRTVSAN